MKKWKIVIVIAFSLLLVSMVSIHTEAASVFPIEHEIVRDNQEDIFCVEFDLNGHSVKNSIGQSLEIPFQYIRSGKYAQEPETPVKNGYTFRGWKEKESGDYWDFNKNVVTKNLTLVASWLWDSTLQLDYGDLQWKVSQKYELQNLSEIKSIKKHYLEHRIVEMGAQ